MKKIISIAMTLWLALTFNAFAASIPGYCTDEILSLSKKKSFDMQEFMKDLPAAVVEAKLKAKLPFGKPKDSDEMDIGMTFGCLKAFPENPEQIKALLKDVGLGMAKSMVANEFGENKADLANGVGAGRMGAGNNPALKKCDAIFNPAKKFCYDGVVYDLCDGMSYNPTTHICSGDIANRALCNGVKYNPLKQKCENNILLVVCGTTVYNPATHGCKNNAVFAKPKCGETFYDPATHGCKNNVLIAKCGTSLYDTATHGCKDNVVFALPKCGTEPYNPKTQECRYGAVFEK